MRVNLRRERRDPSRQNYAASWVGQNGITNSATLQGIDLSPSGVGAESPVQFQPGDKVYIQAQEGHPTGYCLVRHCRKHGVNYIVGFELDEETKKTVVSRSAEKDSDYYEFLQISRRAEPATIQRVHRFLASRFHPDNPETGDSEQFVRLQEAFHILSDPQRRADYDAGLTRNDQEPIPAFESVDFLNGVEGEMNRRVAVLSVLYNRCRTNPDDPRVSLAHLEARMGFPREYLDFTTWYLKQKKYITREDNSDFSLTALGVDYVESNYDKLPILQRMLNAGSTSTPSSSHTTPTPAPSGPSLLKEGEQEHLQEASKKHRKHG
ncbi:MAG TPA: DnaJ domain-containing protein [Bryobacteraceae bacterium]|nr:DnaJ domain-containing protein [Bryobacteraceae bacterium]